MTSLAELPRRIASFLFLKPAKGTQRLILPVAWALFIFVLSSIPGSAYPQVAIPFADKVVHAFLYVPLGYWLARAFIHSAGHKSWGQSVILPFTIGALYGLSDEFHQLFVPQRTFSLADWATDCVAVALGLALWLGLLLSQEKIDAVREK
jgi:VanZ family protein